jgi:hypothetical protein
MNEIIKQKNINLFISIRIFQKSRENFEGSIYSNFLAGLFQYTSAARFHLLFRGKKHRYGSGWVLRRPYGRLSGHGSSTEGRGERSLESSRF